MSYSNYKKLDKLLYVVAFLFFAIPLIIFFVGWYKLYITIFVLCALVLVFYIFFKNINYKTYEQYKQIFDLKKWIIILVLLFGLNLLSGIGGYFFQNWDHNARNAVLHDLIDYDFPVKYHYDDKVEIDFIGEEGYMSYYFAYWLPSALIGKAFGFEAANLSLFIYQFLGLSLFYYFISRLFSKVRIRYFFIFLAFSGLDVIGQFITDRSKLKIGTHIDTWSPYFCTSSNVTQLFWVFNQGISSLLIVSLLFNEINFKNVAIYMAFILLFAPFPAVGYAFLILILLILGFYNFNNEINKNKFKDRFKELFSLQNILSLFIIFMIAIFFLINPEGQPKGIIFTKYPNVLSVIKRYVIFWILEFGLISFLILQKKNYKIIIGILIILSVIPFFYIGGGADFVNRVSLPLLMVLNILVMERLNDFEIKKFFNDSKINYKLIRGTVICYLIFSSVTGFYEIYRSIENTVFVNKFDISKNRNDHWKTYGDLNNKEVRDFSRNFSTKYDNNKFMFKYILK